MKRIFRCLLCGSTWSHEDLALAHARGGHSLSANAKDYVIEREVDDLAGDRE